MIYTVPSDPRNHWNLWSRHAELCSVPSVPSLLQWEARAWPAAPARRVRARDPVLPPLPFPSPMAFLLCSSSLAFSRSPEAARLALLRPRKPSREDRLARRHPDWAREPGCRAVGQTSCCLVSWDQPQKIPHISSTCIIHFFSFLVLCPLLHAFYQRQGRRLSFMTQHQTKAPTLPFHSH